jgi:hypothetical protein
MIKQQMQSASLIYLKVSPFLSQLRLVPKVGQWGQLKFEGGLLQKSFTSETSLNYPKPQVTISHKRILSVTNVYNIHKRYKDIQDTTRCK